MWMAGKDIRKDSRERERTAVLDAWPLPSQGTVPEADEPLETAPEGEDEPITEKLPAKPAPRRPDRGD